ncbi:MAG: hypothetical protein V3T23_06475 [Nitrososphaerales archaeon]
MVIERIESDKPADFGSWIQTRSGLKFDALNPTEAMVDILDIAHALSNLCRYNGHVREFYSVAQHCSLGSLALREMQYVQEVQLQFLLHDASEFVLADVPRPFKKYLKNYYEIEAGIQKVILGKYGLPLELMEAVVDMDNRILRTEAEQLFDFPPLDDWHLACGEPVPIEIHPLTPPEAEHQFLRIFQDLTGIGVLGA